MIYFKFPFDETTYSTDENSEQETVIFESFDQSHTLSFHGNPIKIEDSDFENITSTTSSLQKNNFIAETQDEYFRHLNEIIKVIQDNQLPKIVYSRRKIFRNFNEIDLKESFKNLCKSYPNAFRYLFKKDENVWMGAFSEVLGKFNKLTHEFETMSLAGTIPVEDSWSEKEIEEQKPVSAYIRNVLEKFSTKDKIYESETYDHISGNIKHLKTDFRLIIHPEDLDSIIKELHPTPAVCGIPKDFCKENIEKFEKYSRELYAGYIRIETEEFIQYFVNLRCARFYQDCVHLFVGGGITAQSNPEIEWTETELKSQAVLKNLIIVS